MISRTYTVDDGSLRCYKGFDRTYTPARLSLVALVRDEDVVQVYALDDNEEARAEFFRYLRDEGKHADCIGIYRR